MYIYLTRQHEVKRIRILFGRLLIVSGLVMRLATPFSSNCSYLVIAAYAFLGRKQAIQSLLLSWLFTMINPGLVPSASWASVARYLVVGAAVASIGVRINKSNITNFFIATITLGFFFTLHSIMFSPMVDVSIMKSIAWTMTMGLSICACSGLSIKERALLARWIFKVLSIVMILSCPFVFLPVGYLINGKGFQGILNHPQVFGTTMAILNASAASRLLQKRNPQWSTIAILIICSVLIVLSEARTAGFAFMIGVSVAISYKLFRTKYSILHTFPGLRNPRLIILFNVAFTILLIAGPMLTDQIKTYIFKRGDAQSVFGAYTHSRGQLIQAMLDNIKEKPFEGIGFGIPSDLNSVTVRRDSLLGLPVGAAVEKGVLPFAILEETGIFGALLVSLWIVVLIYRTGYNNFEAIAISATAILNNIGEYTLFSTGGAGLLSLIILGWAASSSTLITIQRKFYYPPAIFFSVKRHTSHTREHSI